VGENARERERRTTRRTGTVTSLWQQTAPRIPTDDVEPHAHYDVVVVGAGLTGLTTAVLLARAGRRVAVLEAREVGAVATGRTTGKLSVLQGQQLQRIRRSSGHRVLRAYVEANRAGFDWLLDYAAPLEGAVERRDAYSYAGTPEGIPTVRAEHEAAVEAGLDARLVSPDELPFPSYGAVMLPDQAQLDPLVVLAALAAELRSLGGVVVEGARVLGLAARPAPVRVATTCGEMRAEQVVIATGSPVLDRGLYWAKLTPRRSYALAFRAPGPLPRGMYLSVDSPTRSLRTVDHAGEELLLVGGNGHGVGRHDSPASCVDDLTAWTLQHWPGAERTHAWSAQDYETPHRVPFCGWMPRGAGRVYLATGYDKWGMTNAVQCAITIAATLTDDDVPAWARTLGRRLTTPQALAAGLGANAAVGWWYAKGYARALAHRLGDDAPVTGEGEIGRDGWRITAASRVDGVECRVSGICTHLGAALTWNDQERSWDCPAHGSRFSAAGEVLEGPATRALARR
jgi:glycine/D-amino acid oxidase-like deaminating enzyme/nitrite reductase/ring-hydroxylating ferredoxin subunit